MEDCTGRQASDRGVQPGRLVDRTHELTLGLPTHEVTSDASLPRVGRQALVMVMVMVKRETPARM